MDDLDTLAIENFREYLRIPSVHPDIDYDQCITFIKKQAKDLKLPIQIHYCFPHKPIAIVTWVGEEPNLPPILLNSHMDVVPVFKDKWTHDTFGAEIDDKGNVYARGVQDMKSVGVQYLEAIRRLKQDKVTLKRTIHISFVPVEEIGGAEGMGSFVKSKEFEKLNIGFSLDEGVLSTNNLFGLIYGEKTRWVIHIHCPGQPGHGSLLLGNTVGAKVQNILNNFYKFIKLRKL